MKLHLDLDQIPHELRDRDQWVGFLVEPPAASGGRLQKTPLVADDPTRKASSTKPTTWRSFDVAVAGLRQGKFNAIGYALNDDYTCIDLDHFPAECQPTPFAASAIDRCASYTEWSASRKGVHVLLHGTLPDDCQHAFDDAEVYGTTRFIVITGDRLPDRPEQIQQNDEAVK